MDSAFDFIKFDKSKKSKKEMCLANPDNQWVLKKSKGGRKSGYCRLRSTGPRKHPKQDCEQAGRQWVKKSCGKRGYCRSISMSPRKQPKQECEQAGRKWVKKSCGRKGYCRSISMSP